MAAEWPPGGCDRCDRRHGGDEVLPALALGWWFSAATTSTTTSSTAAETGTT
jgi:hypothetical protein